MHDRNASYIIHARLDHFTSLLTSSGWKKRISGWVYTSGRSVPTGYIPRDALYCLLALTEGAGGFINFCVCLKAGGHKPGLTSGVAAAAGAVGGALLGHHHGQGYGGAPGFAPGYYGGHQGHHRHKFKGTWCTSTVMLCLYVGYTSVMLCSLDPGIY